METNMGPLSLENKLETLQYDEKLFTELLEQALVTTRQQIARVKKWLADRHGE